MFLLCVCGGGGWLYDISACCGSWPTIWVRHYLIDMSLSETLEPSNASKDFVLSVNSETSFLCMARPLISTPMIFTVRLSRRLPSRGQPYLGSLPSHWPMTFFISTSVQYLREWRKFFLIQNRNLSEFRPREI